MAKVQKELTAGTVIDEKYRIERYIGRGGMGCVYEASQFSIGRKVALKILPPRYAADGRAIQRFKQEARRGGSIAHINICEVTDLGETEDGTPYMTMPLLTGCSLAEKLKSLDKIDTKTAVHIVVQILSALKAAHAAHIVHRDLKPANVFITKIDQGEILVKLLDFGISKALNQDLDTNLTTTGTVLGTPHYMAPEQAKGVRDIDHRVDIYAAGVILYEALTGERPFDGESYNEIVVKIATEKFRRPGDLNPAVSMEIEQILLKAMATNPCDRFQDAEQMRSALLHARVAKTDYREQRTTAAIKALPFETSSPSRDTTGRTAANGSPGSRRRPIAMILAILGFLALTVLIFSLVAVNRNRPSQTITDAEPREISEEYPGDNLKGKEGQRLDESKSKTKKTARKQNESTRQDPHTPSSSSLPQAVREPKGGPGTSGEARENLAPSQKKRDLKSRWKRKKSAKNSADDNQSAEPSSGSQKKNDNGTRQKIEGKHDTRIVAEY